MIMNGYQQYKQQSVDTMTSGEMLILLFDGAVRNVTSAGLAWTGRIMIHLKQQLRKRIRLSVT